MYHKNTTYKLFNVFNYAGLTLLAIACMLPLVHLLAVSLSGAAKANANLVTFWPLDFTYYAYKISVWNEQFVSSFWISIQRTALGTTIGVMVMSCAAYSLSKSPSVLKGRAIYLWYFVFTMLFNGGLIPGYILIRNLNLLDNIWALILPLLVNVYNVILLLNFFRNVPAELEESAMIDGAGHSRIFWSIYLPISMPALATITLFTMVMHWSNYFDGLLFMKELSHMPLASYIQTIITQQDFRSLSVEQLANYSNRTLKGAQIFIFALPVLLVYPLLQRYFVKGIVLGSVKE